MGCGDDEPDPAAIGAATVPPPSADLAWAVAERPRTLDPLYARTAAEQLAARQVHEPLVAELTAPYGSARRTPGLALAARPAEGATVWRVPLRSGVRFHDGEPFNAAAVLANVDRWLATPEGRAELGELLVDAPRPGLVRFILPAPDPEFDRRLASPRLGIVSPRALDEAAGAPLDPAELPDSGTGPFELRERSADRLLLAHNSDWWGAERGLGPGIDQLELREVSRADERLGMLADGSVRVAEIGPGQVGVVRSDPLLTVVRQDAGRALGIERSVRGIPPGDPAPALNAVWVTGIGVG